MLWLTGLAVIISAFAAVVAWQSRDAARKSAEASEKSANEAEKSTNIAAKQLTLAEEEQWQRREPTFFGEYKLVDGAPGIALRNDGPMDYEQVSFRMPRGQNTIGAIQLPGYEGDADDGFHSTGPLGSFDRGERRAFRIRRGESGGEARLILDVIRGNNSDSWQVECGIEIPGVPRVTWI